MVSVCQLDFGMSPLHASLSLPPFPHFTQEQLVEIVYNISRPCANNQLD